MQEPGGDAADSAFGLYNSNPTLKHLKSWYMTELNSLGQICQTFDICADGVSRYIELCARTLRFERTGLDHLTLKSHLVLAA